MSWYPNGLVCARRAVGLDHTPTPAVQRLQQALRSRRQPKARENRITKRVAVVNR